MGCRRSRGFCLFRQQACCRRTDKIGGTRSRPSRGTRHRGGPGSNRDWDVEPLRWHCRKKTGLVATVPVSLVGRVIVLEPGLVIFKIYNGYWFFGRPTIEELWQDLRAVLKKCRPDWDITTPELKTA
jgi:hypothetical protein